MVLDALGTAWKEPSGAWFTVWADGSTIDVSRLMALALEQVS